ncbi:MAG: YcgN family cysteine cluster protein [Pseudomonadota bacterium]
MGRKPSLRSRFWETLPLERLAPDEWEALCDGCGKCCVVKLEDEETGKVHYTDVACRLFDPDTCRCGFYAIRQRLVSGCVVLTPSTLPDVASWLPETCAYRRRYENRALPDWHPLVAGGPEKMHESGASMKGRTVPEWEVPEDELQDHVVDDE